MYNLMAFLIDISHKHTISLDRATYYSQQVIKKYYVGIHALNLMCTKASHFFKLSSLQIIHRYPMALH